MNFREAVPTDFAFVADHTASRGCFAKQPLVVDYVYALEHEGNVLGIGGVKLLNASTAWAWFDLTTFAKPHMIVVYRVIREWLAKLAKMHGITRMQAAVEVDFHEAVHTVEHLGFRRESIMERFFGDKHGYMVAKFYGPEAAGQPDSASGPKNAQNGPQDARGEEM